MDDADIVALAKQAQAELPSLLPVASVAAVDAELASLVDRAQQGEAVGAAILRLLREYPMLRQWANERLAPSAFRRVVPPPGDHRLPLAPRFVCPNGDFEYFLVDVSRPVPTCPHDGATLIPGNPA